MSGSVGSVEAKIRQLARRGAPAPLAPLLRSARTEAARWAYAEHALEIAELGPRLEAGEAAARTDLDALAERAFIDMRSRVRASANRAGLSRSITAVLDAWFRHTRESEYLDDPELDPAVRLQILAHLDGLNDLLGSYIAFFDHLTELLDRDRPSKILDLAAGHGGFAVAATRLARARGYRLQVVASDIRSEYLEIGACRARAAKLEVSFRVQDALDLSNVAPGEFDVVMCTQSLHHFRPGQVAVMFAEAARIAARGVLFIDGARSALNAAAVAGIGLLAFRDRAFAHDAFVSFRRFFVPEELMLLARLSPWGAQATALWIPPAHCLLRGAKRFAGSSPPV